MGCVGGGVVCVCGVWGCGVVECGCVWWCGVGVVYCVVVVVVQESGVCVCSFPTKILNLVSKSIACEPFVCSFYLGKMEIQKQNFKMRKYKAWRGYLWVTVGGRIMVG